MGKRMFMDKKEGFRFLGGYTNSGVVVLVKISVDGTYVLQRDGLVHDQVMAILAGSRFLYKNSGVIALSKISIDGMYLLQRDWCMVR
ncbi:hypothetical protein AVEN_231599-1 [Araneus ventricosus]|uniref:Uncharacterized protein n=1 Tax=Araneus ventricosus TaxID=182803 RepID=A0A4Y2H812_ARAVE|nr:hypothetical protein AVEN_231599-1 [Araneus ventricosus]